MESYAEEKRKLKNEYWEILPTDQPESFHVMTAKVELGGYFCGILITILAEILVLFLGKQLMFRLKNMNRKIFYGLNTAIVILSFGITMLVVGGKENLLEVSLFPVMLFCIIYIVGYRIAKLVTRYKTFGTIRKPKDSAIRILRESMKNTYKQTIQNELPLELKKRFHKKNEEQKRKGKREITPEEYMGILREENRQIKYVGVFLMVCFGIVLILWIQALVVEITMVEMVLIPCFLMIILLFLYVGNKTYKVREEVLEDLGQFLEEK